MDEHKDNNTQLNPELAKRPILDEQPTDLIHTRRNLLIINSIFLFSVFSNVSLSPKFINGNFEDKLTVTDIHWAILFVTTYLFLSFLWKFKDYCNSQALLSTNDIELYWVQNIGNVTELRTYRDPKQYSLAGWWARTSDSLSNIYIEIEEKVQKLNSEKHLKQELYELKQKLDQLEYMYSAATNEQVVDALKHFDKSVIRFIYSQNRRIFLLEGLLPIILTLISYYFLFEKIAFYDFTKTLCV